MKDLTALLEALDAKVTWARGYTTPLQIALDPDTVGALTDCVRALVLYRDIFKDAVVQTYDGTQMDSRGRFANEALAALAARLGEAK